MPIVSNAGNKQMNVGKMQIKEGNHGNLPWVTSRNKTNSKPIVSAWRRKDPLRGSHGADPPNNESPST